MKTKVMSYNLRCDVDSDGINAFRRRYPFVFERLAALEVDIIGFQEVMPHMRDMLMDKLEGYTVVGTAREQSFDGESCVIAFRSSKFDLHALDTFWLSDTPDVPGSHFMTDQSPCPRVCTKALLRQREKGAQPFWFYNFHLDHVGKFARAQGLTLILADISRECSRSRRSDGKKTDFVLTGDFNATPASPVIESMSKHPEFAEATASITGTFHNWGRMTPEKIDYIYTSAEFSDPCVITDSRDGVYMSDHYPVSAVIEL